MDSNNHYRASVRTIDYKCSLRLERLLRRLNDLGSQLDCLDASLRQEFPTSAYLASVAHRGVADSR